MKTLALEFSSNVRSVAALDLDEKGSPVVRGRVIEEGRSVANAFKMIEAVLDQAGWSREEVERIAVGLGPGSHTGIRAAIAIAQGWSLASEVRLDGVSSATTLAAQARAAGYAGAQAVAIDAQRGEFHAARIDPADSSGEPELRLVGTEELNLWAGEGIRVVGPDLEKRIPQALDLHPDAAQVGRLALIRDCCVDGESLEPIYLRETSFVKAPPPRVIPSAGE